MKPFVFVSLALFCVVYAGNACMKSGFQAHDLEGPPVRYASCAADESTLNRDLLADTAIGYIGDRRVSFAPYGDNTVLIEGDMIVPIKGASLPSKPLPKGISQGVGVKFTQNRWPNGIIPYRVPVSFPDKYRIDEAVKHWNDRLGGVITFVPWSNQAAYAQINNAASGCAAYVGYQGAMAHTVDISLGCSTGNVIHELGHIIGLQHEQNRIDRDSYVSINWSKIDSSMAANFESRSDLYQDYGAYDFGSIMHYFLEQFSVDGSPTIVPKVSVPADVVIGQRVRLSLGDINSARMIYGASTLSAYPIVDGDPTEPAPTPTGTEGLTASYYQRVDFMDLKAAGVSPAIDYDWGTGSPVSEVKGSSFSVRWRGMLVPPQAGDYKFMVTATGGFKMQADGTTVFDRMDNIEKNTYVSQYYNLDASVPIYITLDYVSSGTDNQIQLKWINPNGVEEVIPSAYMVADEEALNELANVCTVAHDSY